MERIVATIFHAAPTTVRKGGQEDVAFVLACLQNTLVECPAACAIPVRVRSVRATRLKKLCGSGHAPTARLVWGPRRGRGTLSVRLGGRPHPRCDLFRPAKGNDRRVLYPVGRALSA